MQENQTAPHPDGFALADVYYVLFRRKWLIASFAVLGVVAAIVVSALMPRVYQSEAQLYLRYVLESPSPSQVGPDHRIRQFDEAGEAGGATAMNTELAILSSLDLAQQVADAIGPEKILGHGQGGSNGYLAALLIQNSVLAVAPKRSNLIRVAFQHSDPAVVQLVLSRVIDFYFKKHSEIHAVGAFDEFLTQETDQLRSRLVQTEEQLRLAKAKAGVISLEETKLSYAAQINRIRQELLEAEAQLAERKAAADRLAELLHTRPLGATNQTVVAAAPEKIAEYRRLNVLLDNLKTKEQELLLLYTPSNSMLKGVQGQIAANESLKQQLERENPGLLTVKVSETRTAGNDQLPAQGTDVIAEMARVAALESRVKVLTDQLDKSRTEATAVNNAEASITVLQRQRDLEEQHYRRFIENLEQSRIDEKLGSGKVSNISVIQQPSPPLKAPSKRLQMMAGALFGCLIGGLALAFLLELFLDHSLKRPVEVENKLGLPLFLAIPEMARHGKSRRLKTPGTHRLLNANGESKPVEQDHEIAKAAGNGGGPPANGGAAMRAFADALRDRLTLYFEVKNLTHKPKLVALTSCSPGAGVTTIAAGLAASLSEGGDGNVLLVDMTAEQGAAHHYYRGKLECGLDDALESEKRSGALMQDNLYVVSEGGNRDNLPRMLPKRFTNLVPKLKASDYDYIIFDMPPISQISITPKLARFMDAVLMVVESEKTDREAARRAVSLLHESKGNVGVVMNKHRTYVPRRLQPEM